MVGERSVSLRRCVEKHAGGIRSANADMSNVKAGEKPARRKPKVSCSTFIDGNQVNIPGPLSSMRWGDGV